MIPKKLGAPAFARPMLAAALLASAGLGCAHLFQQDPPAATSAGKGGAGKAGPEPAQTDQGARSYSAQGEVIAVDFAQGRLELRSGEETLKLRAHPLQLRPLQPGDSASVRYRSVGGELWLLWESEVSGTFELQGSIRGPVQSLDLARGVLEFSSLRFLAHPAQLSGLIPGECVRVDFALIEGQDWLTAVGPCPR